jgi:WD40 repeat protein
VLASFAGVPCCLAMTKDQGKLAIMLSDREVHLWDAKKNVPVGPIMMHPGSVRLVQFSDDEKTLFTFDQDGTLRCWNVATGKLTLVVPNPCDEPIALTGISKDGRFHAFVTETNSLHVYRRF